MGDCKRFLTSLKQKLWIIGTLTITISLYTEKVVRILGKKVFDLNFEKFNLASSAY